MAQVGIGTVTLAGALDVNFSNDGHSIPRLAFSATNVATVLTQQCLLFIILLHRP